ncbi:hypothetical protein EV424DRAFT_629968 [Suillus variegatus]|nr:hypothetical protein EV424DRAFT_629968 [Suillus variegatus]
MLIFINSCVLFGVCMYALFSAPKQLHWILSTLLCVFHISVATAHNILSLLLFLEAFTNPAIVSIPDGTIIYYTILYYTIYLVRRARPCNRHPVTLSYLTFVRKSLPHA